MTQGQTSLHKTSSSNANFQHRWQPTALMDNKDKEEIKDQCGSTTYRVLIRVLVLESAGASTAKYL